MEAQLVAWGPLGLAVAAFLAGSVVPFPSEAVLAALVTLGRGAAPLVLLATAANAAGAATLLWIGRGGRAAVERRIGTRRLAGAEARFARHGRWLLLLTWLPWVGDAFVLVAGLLRVPWAPALALVAVGKGLRYTTVALAVILAT